MEAFDIAETYKRLLAEASAARLVRAWDDALADLLVKALGDIETDPGF